jgi:hypothetical protein
VTIKGKEHNVELWETTDQLSYPNTDVFLMCFSVADRTSYDNIKSKWLDGINQCIQNPNLLLEKGDVLCGWSIEKVCEGDGIVLSLKKLGSGIVFGNNRENPEADRASLSEMVTGFPRQPFHTQVSSGEESLHASTEFAHNYSRGVLSEPETAASRRIRRLFLTEKESPCLSGLLFACPGNIFWSR